jgi:hypothetical protein
VFEAAYTTSSNEEHIKNPDIPIIHQKTRLKFHAMTGKLNTKVLKSSYAAL